MCDVGGRMMGRWMLHRVLLRLRMLRLRGRIGGLIGGSGGGRLCVHSKNQVRRRIDQYGEREVILLFGMPP